MRQILPNAHSDLTRGWGLGFGGSGYNIIIIIIIITVYSQNPWKSEKEIKEVIPFWFNPRRSSAQMSNPFILLFTIFDKLPPLYSFY